MDANQFINIAKDPDAWLRTSVLLRQAADKLYDDAVLPLSQLGPTMADAMDRGGQEIRIDGLTRAVELFQLTIPASLLYGLALETALKGAIIRQCPRDVEFLTQSGRKGKSSVTAIKRIGVRIGGGGHNLVELAKFAGVFEQSSTALFAAAEHASVRGTLEYLAACIRWRAKYPIPLNSDDARHGPLSPFSGRRGKQHLREWIDPILDRYGTCPS